MTACGCFVDCAKTGSSQFCRAPPRLRVQNLGARNCSRGAAESSPLEAGLSQLSTDRKPGPPVPLSPCGRGCPPKPKGRRRTGEGLLNTKVAPDSFEHTIKIRDSIEFKNAN